MSQPKRLLSFKDWMAENNRAYYALRAPGKEGDFITSPLVHRAFGEAVARQILEMDEQLGHPDPFYLIEFGGGNGQLAVDILKCLYDEAPRFFARLKYGISDFPEPLQNFQSRFAQEFPDAMQNIQLLPPFMSRWGETIPEFPGCVLANEFLDALPVHLIVKRGTEYREIFIQEKPEGIEIVEMPPSPDVHAFIQSHAIDLQDGHFAEINLEMQSWIRTVSSSLKRGFVLVLDYGAPGEELRSSRYPEGTLRGFKNHKLADVFRLQLGEGDWTSDVDFSALVKIAKKEGFSLTGYSTQGNFLIGLGAVERMPIFKKKELDANEIKEHLAMKFLFHPEGMGNAFNVLGLHKGMEAPRLSGFSLRQEQL